nr:mycofactocin precursor peptide peptidase-like [Nerophis lumbriciformis]
MTWRSFAGQAGRLGYTSPMPIHHISEMTWTEVEALDLASAVALLPVGAVEAHGPHLPLSTDRVISIAMVEDAAGRLAEGGLDAIVLPPVDYTAASFAAAFPGTVSVRPETVTALLVDIAAALASHGIGTLAVANSHFDPVHLGSLYAAKKEIEKLGRPRLVFPDVTRKPWAHRLTDEFKSGACHAGCYEGSIVLAARPELVREEVGRGLEPVPVSLSTAILEGQSSFAEAGGPRAYFGDPAAASAEEGRRTIEVLGEILAEAVLAGD